MMMMMMFDAVIVCRKNRC